MCQNPYYKFNSEIRFNFDKFRKSVLQMRDARKSRGIFVCSTFEIFHPITLTKFQNTKEDLTWRDFIFEMIEKFKQHRFYILTKFPENIDRPMPENVWLGVTVTDRNSTGNIDVLSTIDAKIRFISFEPWFDNHTIKSSKLINLRHVDWAIIGGLTGHSKKWLPSKHSVWHLAHICMEQKIPIFLKDNLRSVWGKEELIQQMLEEGK
jgi:protein gp37